MRRIKNKTAFSLVELLMAFAIIVIVFAAIVPQFRAIRNSWAATEAGAAIIQNGRVLAEHFSRNLSSAKKIIAVSGSGDANGYITFQDNSGVTKRYMLSGGYVVFGSLGSEAQLAGTVSSFKIACYSLNDFATPITEANSIRLVKFETNFPNDNAMGSGKIFKSEVFIQTNVQDSNAVSFEPGVAMANYIDYGSNKGIFNSYNSSNGYYGGNNVSSNAVITVNAINGEVITLYSKAKLNGDAYIGPDGDVDTGIGVWSKAVITGIKGTLEQEIDMAAVAAPSGSPFDNPNQGTLERTSGGYTINTDRHYNHLYIWNSAYVLISGNITILLDGNLELSNSASLRIASGSSLKLYVRGNCNLGGDLNAHYDRHPSDLKIYMLGNNRQFNLYGNSDVYALLDNPNGPITNWNSRQFYGQMRGKSLEGNGGIHIDLDSRLFGSSGSSGGGEVLP
ncbi:MAG: PilW family protein [Sedimentisphaerales bacterium]